MNKDLLIIFVIGPLVVEIGKAFIKEYQDRKDLKRRLDKKQEMNARSMLLDVERTFRQYSSEMDGSTKEELRSYLLRIMAEASETLRHLSNYDNVRDECLSIMHTIGAHVFNDRATPEAAKETIRGQVTDKVDSVLVKIGLNGAIV